jgi:hypothetical protein
MLIINKLSNDITLSANLENVNITLSAKLRFISSFLQFLGLLDN